MSNIKKLLDTMELIHYIKINKGKVFVLLIKGQNYIRDIIPDIIILQSFDIKFVIAIEYTEEEKQKIEHINQKFTQIIWEIAAMLKKHSLSPMSILGTNISVKKRDDNDYAQISEIEWDTLKYALLNNKIPVVAPFGMDYRGNYHLVDAKDLALEIAKELSPATIFYISEVEGIKINENVQQFLNYKQVMELIEKNIFEKSKVDDILKYAIKVMDAGIKDISVLSYDTGNIYKKILTYDIAGTLISKVDEEIIRIAEIEDISSIYLLIKNEMERNNILPVTEEEIEETINEYMVYDIDNSVIAAGKLKYYGEGAEIAKIATYPRYQGGKKAKQLCMELVKKAEKENLKFVFGLTINPGMMRLFESIGFKEIARENLPEEWKENYDFKRPSKAFIKYINCEIINDK